MDLSRFSAVIDFENLLNPEDTWDLREKIGEGTFGEVYRAVHKQTGHEIAVKVLDSIHEVIEEVEEEYKILRDLGTHSNLPAFHGLFLTQPEPPEKPQLWIAMELCRGGSVTDLVRAELQRGSHLPELLLAHILKEVLQALYHLHSNHVVHRDVKGHNILLTSDAKVKLIDFGVSGHLENTLSRRHTSVGTPFWMAPEVIACEQQLDYTYDVRCDVWSLGVTAIELADGEPPFAELHPMRALFKIPRSPPPTLKQPSKWSERFRDFISCCVVKDFEKRSFVKQLLNHPFITQVSEHSLQVQQQLERLVNDSGHMIQEPYITSKKDQQSEEDRETHQTMEDLARLETLDEESIVTCLEERYNDNQIYTYMGDILLAVNPFTTIPIYTPQWSSQYIDAVKGDHPPHIYAVADHAYQEMMHHQHNQSVVISGESGAGKTENANFLVQQLTMLGKAPNRNLEERILLVNPLVEAFGNAATVINDNSSRFGKYLEMSFTPSGKVTGASMTEYLLEKSRVVQQASGEQNFHVFYYIYHGLCQEDKMGKYHLQDQTVYRYLTSVDNDPKAVAAHRLKYRTVQKCFEIIGFKSQEVSSVYSILAAVLHLGNVDFIEAESHHDTRTKVKDNQLQHLELLGIDTKELGDSLTSSGMVARGETIVKHYTVAEATSVRDAMAKALYGRLFSWIVNKINLLLKPGRQQGYGEERNMIGILDIFGFENFTHNSFEQLCINIANEQIQSYFNQHIFLWEQKEYAAEGIDPVTVTFTDNQPVLELLLAKPLGLLALLDEESNFPKATDQSLVDKFAANLPGTHFNLIRSHDLGFSVQHYAGTVVYDSGGFLEKNRDRLALEVTSVLRTSQVALVRTLFNAKISKTGALRGNQSGPTGSLPKESATLPSWSIRSASNSSTLSQSRLQQTVASYFRFSLTDLLSKLVSGTPHFVRCIRPNTENSPSYFDRQKVLVQLRYTGVLETTRIRREGFPHRIHYSEFVNRYSMMTSSNEKPISGNRENCAAILQKLGLKDYALGKTKVFLKYYEQEKLCRLYADYQRHVVCLQAWFRMWLQKRRYQKLLTQRESAAINMQRAVRGWLCRAQYLQVQVTREKAAITIQTELRGYMARCKYKPLIETRRAAALTLQAATRGHLQRRRYHELKNAREHSATNIQAAVRGYLCRRGLNKQKERMKKEQTHLNWAATVLQKNFKMWKAQAEVTKRQLQSQAEEKDRVVFNQQMDKNTVKMFHSQVLSMDRSSSTESEDWSDERKELMQRVVERKQVWGVPERDYYYGMQTVNAGKSQWVQQRDNIMTDRPSGTHINDNHSEIEQRNGFIHRIDNGTKQYMRTVYKPTKSPGPDISDRRRKECPGGKYHVETHQRTSKEHSSSQYPVQQRGSHEICVHNTGKQNTCDNCKQRRKDGINNEKCRQKSHRKAPSDKSGHSDNKETRTELSARLGGCRDHGDESTVDIVTVQKPSTSASKKAEQSHSKSAQLDIHPMFFRQSTVSCNNTYSQIVPQTPPLHSGSQTECSLDEAVPQTGNGINSQHTKMPITKSRERDGQHIISYTKLPNHRQISNSPINTSEIQNLNPSSPILQSSSDQRTKIIVKHVHTSHPTPIPKAQVQPNDCFPSANVQHMSYQYSTTKATVQPSIGSPSGIGQHKTHPSTTAKAKLQPNFGSPSVNVQHKSHTSSTTKPKIQSYVNSASANAQHKSHPSSTTKPTIQSYVDSASAKGHQKSHLSSTTKPTIQSYVDSPSANGQHKSHPSSTTKPRIQSYVDSPSANGQLKTHPSSTTKATLQPNVGSPSANLQHKSHPSSPTHKPTIQPHFNLPVQNNQYKSKQILHQPPVYSGPLTKPRKTNCLEPSKKSASPPSRSDASSRTAHKIVHIVERQHKSSPNQNLNESSTATVLTSDSDLNVTLENNHKPPVPVKPRHLQPGSNSTGLVYHQKSPPSRNGDRHQTTAPKGKKSSKIQQNGSLQQDSEESNLEEKHRKELEEIDDMFNSVIELYTSQSENSRFLEDDGPSQREELQRETRDLQEQLVQSLEVQKKSSLSSRFIQEEKRANRMAVRNSQKSEDKETQLKNVKVAVVPGPRDASGPVQVDFRSVLKKRGAKEEVQRLRTHILVS